MCISLKEHSDAVQSVCCTDNQLYCLLWEHTLGWWHQITKKRNHRGVIKANTELERYSLSSAAFYLLLRRLVSYLNLGKASCVLENSCWNVFPTLAWSWVCAAQTTRLFALFYKPNAKIQISFLTHSRFLCLDSQDIIWPSRYLGPFVSSPNTLMNILISVVCLDYVLPSPLCSFLLSAGAFRHSSKIL